MTNFRLETIWQDLRYALRTAFLFAATVSCSWPVNVRKVTDGGASSLKNHIPPPEPSKYRSVLDARDRQNPYFMVQANGIDARPISAATEAPTMSPADVVAYLEKLPPSHGPMALS
jgi:hypothetical protein